MKQKTDCCYKNEDCPICPKQKTEDWRFGKNHDTTCPFKEEQGHSKTIDEILRKIFWLGNDSSEYYEPTRELELLKQQLTQALLGMESLKEERLPNDYTGLTDIVSGKNTVRREIKAEIKELLK